MMKFIKDRYCLLLISLLACVAAEAQQAKGNLSTFTGENRSFNKGWKFFLGDVVPPDIKGHGESYSNAKAGRASGAAAPAFNDKAWRTVDLPHDWSVELPIDSTENVSQGYYPRGIGWYRRKFKLDSADRGKHLEIQFEGVATHCTVWINGLVVHRNWSGYTSFYIDISDIARYGGEVNTIAVRVDARDQEGWWYEGAGIYRNVWLVKRNPVHIITDGVFANPVPTGGQDWKIPAEVTVSNNGKGYTPVQMEITVYDQQRHVIAAGKANGAVGELGQTILKTDIAVHAPHAWDIVDPYLYRVVTKISKGDEFCDSVVTYCGFRTIRFDPDKGFFLNDRHVKIKGVCNHQDHAGVGVAVPASIWEFRLRKLKEMGINAIRCSHNPPAREVLDLCDRMGILVMDENRNFNSSPEYISQLKWMVQRDRNHPGIILWSVFNEEPMQGSEQGYEMVRKMRASVRELDTTRPVTAAMNGGLFTPINVSQAVDVVGFNYQINLYDRFHKAHPEMPLTSSEDASGLMQRGVYQTDRNKHLLDAYDDQKPAWGATHRVAWKAIAERDFLAGCFVWTGFDYRGEPTPFTWPTVSSNFGSLDMCGFPKTAFYIYQAQWLEGKDVIHIEPYWNWPKDTVGKPVKVMVMSNAETVRLTLNGKMIGEQKVDPYEMNSWMVPYQPGKLEAIGLKKGREITRTTVETTGEPVRVKLTPDRASILGNGENALPVTVELVDAKGRHVPTAGNLIKFEISDNASIIGVGNGDPNSHESDKAHSRSLYNGFAQSIIQTFPNAEGKVKLTATCAGMKSQQLEIPVTVASESPFVPVIASKQEIEGWRMSEASSSKPDPNRKMEANDMNSWSPVKSGQLQEIGAGKYAIFRAAFTADGSQAANDLQVTNVTGKAWLYLDGRPIAEKNDVAAHDISVRLPSLSGNHTLSILIQAGADGRAGLGGVVTVEPSVK